MAGKISTLVLKVDLDCHLCDKKIRKTLSKLQEKEHIQSIIYDEKNNTVTVSGPFDPHRLIKKICCKACRVIKEIQIKENKPKEPEPAKEKPKQPEPAKEKPKPAVEPAKVKPKPAAEPAKEKAAEPKKDKSNGNGKPKDPKPAELAEPKKDKPKPAEPAGPKQDKPKPIKADPPPVAEPVKVDPVPAGPVPVPGITYEPVWPERPGCYCRPWNEGYYGDYRGCTCGCGGGYGPYGWAPERPPVVVCTGPGYGGGGYQTCTFFCEEEPQYSCTIM